MPDGWLRRPLVTCDDTMRVVRVEPLAGEADRSVATEFWAGVLVPFFGPERAGADRGEWTLPLDPDGEALCELVRQRDAGRTIRMECAADEIGRLPEVVESLRRAQEVTGAPLHEVLGWWTGDRWRMEGPLCGGSARLVLLAGLDYAQMKLTPQSVARILV